MKNDDEALEKKASRRAGFKIHVVIFILANLLLWVFWFFILKGRSEDVLFQGFLFLSITWFIILVAHYLFVYKWNKTLIEKELIKLKKENKKQESELEKMRKEVEIDHQKMNTQSKND